jgi:PAS domain S-box-containing protein
MKPRRGCPWAPQARRFPNARPRSEQHRAVTSAIHSQKPQQPPSPTPPALNPTPLSVDAAGGGPLTATTTSTPFGTTRNPARMDRAGRIFDAHLLEERSKTDRVFYWLFMCQWALAVLLALTVSSRPWASQTALVFGAAINAVPMSLIFSRPGWWATRHAVAVAQMVWSGLIIHLCDGRIETHFHVFGSLAFLAFYRDERVLASALSIAIADHALRGALWPQSIYGIADPPWWRFVEHSAWMLFECTVLVVTSRRGLDEMWTRARREASLEGVKKIIEEQVERKTSELRASMERYRTLVEHSHAVPWEIDAKSLAFTYISPQVAELFGHQTATFVANPAVWEIVHPDDRERVKDQLHTLASTDGTAALDFECRMDNADGDIVQVRTLVSRSDDGRILRGIMFDVTHQKKLELELRQAQKLESVGRLAAGVAHEINTPVQFVNDSVHFLRDAMVDLARLIEVLRAHAAGDPDIADIEDEIDLAYLLEHVPKALDRSVDGLSRVATIVRSMKEFAHPDQRDTSQVDLNHAIQSTLTIARNEYKYVADVHTDFGDVPLVTCNGGEINQVVLNLVVNAAHAIADRVRGTDRRGVITLSTLQAGDNAIITVADTGGGIPTEIGDRIFDPFFTTKEVGKGTGQGLAISRSVVIDKHGGQLSFASEAGVGTTFTIRLPIAGRAAA